MSNGSGPIIIRSLRSTPGVTISEAAFLDNVLSRYETTHKCTRSDVFGIFKIMWRLLR